MNQEYFLIGFRTTIGKQEHRFIDKTNALNIKLAEKEFKERNNFKRLLEKNDLTITKSVRWFQ